MLSRFRLSCCRMKVSGSSGNVSLGPVPWSDFLLMGLPRRVRSGSAGFGEDEEGWVPGCVAGRVVCLGVATLVTTLLGILALAPGRGGPVTRCAGCRPSSSSGERLDACWEFPACGRCTAACPMGVPMQNLARNDRMEHAECILCADCVDTCPKHTLKLGLRAQTRGGVAVSPLWEGGLRADLPRVEAACCRAPGDCPDRRPRGRTTCSITEAGRASLAAWVAADPEDDPTHRHALAVVRLEWTEGELRRSSSEWNREGGEGSLARL